tara:strand:+ start:57 stop:1139 length:1083 start_codon:yes stop_codon:yes gene_type:complete
MNTIDKVLLEWSLKTDKGYPDLNSKEDMDLFESMFGFNLNESFRTLTWAQLKKKTGATPRVVTLYNLIEKDLPVELTSGKKIELEFKDPAHIEFFRNGDLEKIKSIGGVSINSFPFFFEKGKPGNTITLNNLAKTPIFGGKGTGPENAGLRYEQIAISKLNSTIQEIGEPIDIKLGETIYKDITEVVNVGGAPTADFAFVSNNKPVIFISHKNGTTPKDFQQYSGFKYLIEEYEEVRDFVKAVAESTYYTDQALAPKTLLTRGIKEEDIKKKAVYGYEHGKESFSVNNCQALIQGDIWLESKEDYYEINGTKLFTTPNIPSDEYEPVFGVSYRSNMSSMGIQNARFGIYSKDRYPNAVTI